MMHCLSAGSLFDIKGMIFEYFYILCDTIWGINFLVCVTVLFKMFGIGKIIFNNLKETCTMH